MANEEYLEVLLGDVGAWNAWRIEHPDVLPDLSGANLDGRTISIANLSDVNLSGATFHKTDLYAASLWGADLHHADFRAADLRNTYPESLFLIRVPTKPPISRLFG